MHGIHMLAAPAAKRQEISRGVLPMRVREAILHAAYLYALFARGTE